MSRLLSSCHYSSAAAAARPGESVSCVQLCHSCSSCNRQPLVHTTGVLLNKLWFNCRLDGALLYFRDLLHVWHGACPGCAVLLLPLLLLPIHQSTSRQEEKEGQAFRRVAACDRKPESSESTRPQPPSAGINTSMCSKVPSIAICAENLNSRRAGRPPPDANDGLPCAFFSQELCFCCVAYLHLFCSTAINQPLRHCALCWHGRQWFRRQERPEKADQRAD